MKILKPMLVASMISLSSVAHAEEATSYFAETFKIWNEENFSNKHIKHIGRSLQIDITRQESDAAKGGWCNELIVYALHKTGQFEHVKIDVYSSETDDGLATMRGRHWVEMRNPNVTTFHKNPNKHHYKKLDTSKLQAGDIILLDWDGQPDFHSKTYGIDHVTMFMGYAAKPGWGWFMGGNQNAHLQPKMYKLDHITFMSRIDDVGESNARYFRGIKDDVIKLNDYGGKLVDPTYKSYEFVTDDALGLKFDDGFRKNNGKLNDTPNKQLWDEDGIQVQKFKRDDEVLYIETNKNLHVYNDLIVTDEYKDMYSESIAAEIATRHNTAKSFKEQLSWAYSNAKNPENALKQMQRILWNGEEHKQILEYAFKNNDNSYFFNQLAERYKYAVAVDSVQNANKEITMGKTNIRTKAGYEKLNDWTDVVIETLLEDGLIRDDFNLQIKTYKSPLGTIK